MAEYIDRTQAIDAIEVHMYRQDPDDRGVYPLEDWQREQNYAYDLAMEILGNLPAADVKPVVKAKWIWMGDTGDSKFMCSRCKAKENVPTVMGKPTVWEYCPNCGAKIEQEPAPGPYDLLHEEGGWNLQ